MLRDITIGQHFPGNSVVHRCDPRLKIIATIAYIIVLFMASNPLGIALSLALLALLYKVRPVHSTARKAYSPRTYASVTRLLSSAR